MLGLTARATLEKLRAMADANHVALLRHWQAGDQRAGVQFFQAHYDALLRFFRNKVGMAACDDLVQQTFIAVSTARFDARSSVRTWVFSIAWRKLCDHFRAEARRRRIEAPDVGACSAMDLGQSPQTRLEKRAEARLLLEALRRLPIVLQTTLELHYWERLSASQIGTVLETPLGTIKSRIRDGRQRLAREIEAIAQDAEVLRTTLDDLDGWAERVRGAIQTE